MLSDHNFLVNFLNVPFRHFPIVLREVGRGFTTREAAWLHTKVAVPKAGVVANVIPMLLNTSIPPGNYQVSEEQGYLKSPPAFCSCDSEILELSAKIYMHRRGD